MSGHRDRAQRRGKRRLKVLRSHAEHARYMAHLEDEPSAWICRKDVADIVTPYAYSPSIGLYRDDKGRLVFIAETRHRRYEVWEWLGTVLPSDEIATMLQVAEGVGGAR